MNLDDITLFSFLAVRFHYKQRLLAKIDSSRLRSRTGILIPAMKAFSYLQKSPKLMPLMHFQNSMGSYDGDLGGSRTSDFAIRTLLGKFYDSKVPLKHAMTSGSAILPLLSYESDNCR